MKTRINVHFLSLAFSVLLLPAGAMAAQTNLATPPGSGAFGDTVTILPNGNIVVTDPDYDEGAVNIGAVHLYDGNTLSLISTLKGSMANDRVGSFGITVLSNGNYVVVSPNWDNPSPLRADAGAVTWCSGTTGLSGVVSAANSLVGVSSNNFVGRGALNNGVIALANGNYVVASVFWDDPSTPPDVGAITFCNGATGRVGVVDVSNSLIGSSTNDRLGGTVVALPNGNYVLLNANWDNAGMVDAGAVTWGNGLVGITGTISSNNSLVGTTAGDFVSATITPLPNGNYVVGALNWDSPSPPTVNVGAAVFCNGTTGRAGFINANNSLIGGTANDNVSNPTIRVLANSNYVVTSSSWDKPSPAVANAGAVTLCNGNTGTTGLVTSANSLTGATANDIISSAGTGRGILALPNGNFIVASQFWNHPSPSITDVGAVTLCDGVTGRAGQVVSPTNSIFGSTANDWFSRVVVLPNGNYVVYSPDWDNPSPAKVNVGAAALCSGITGRTGAVSVANALVGSTANDRLGDGAGVVALANGNYVVIAYAWDNMATGSNNVGAVTFCDGTTGRTGEINAANSLVGSIAEARVGNGYVTALANGNYVVGTSGWYDSTTAYSVGAATFCNGTTGRTGLVSSANSLVGTTEGDSIADDNIIAFPDGNYMVVSAVWRNGGIASAGAVTLGDGSNGTVGPITSSNSVLGTVADAFDTFGQFYAYDVTRSRLAVARSKQNIVTLITSDSALAPSPTLTIIRAASQATISWTPGTPGFVLQERTNLVAGAWAASPSGATNPVTVPAAVSTKFYRLFKP